MPDQIPAVFRDGAFYPIEPCALPDETPVVVFVQGSSPHITPPLETDPEKRRQIMAELVDRWQRNPLPPNAPRLTREEMHERR